MAEREFPTAPPVIEKDDRFSYDRMVPGSGTRRRKVTVPHHGAVFAPVRWTNLYFPSSHIIFGDIVGGPVAPVFGAGVEDIPVTTTIRGGIFNHTDYFRPVAGGTPEAPGDHVLALRKALNLLMSERQGASSAAPGRSPADQSDQPVDRGRGDDRAACQKDIGRLGHVAQRLPDLRPVVDVGKGRFGHRHAEEGAERLPALVDREDQQSLRRHGRLDSAM